MQQYLNLLKAIKAKGTHKPAAREGMPGTQSLFGHQFRHDLSQGFPALTTKKMYWKGIVTELLWFLRGDTNIKYLIDNKVNIWNEDAYNYYIKIASKNLGEEANAIYYANADLSLRMFTFDEFIQRVKTGDIRKYNDYILGDCGYQYGKVWRDWEATDYSDVKIFPNAPRFNSKKTTIRHIDQIGNIVNNLRNNPKSRRHLVTAIDPGHETDLALYWCHALFQFNCRPLTLVERYNLIDPNTHSKDSLDILTDKGINDVLEADNIPKYYLDCQLYQRSADVFLGVPFNIASYALLTHILAKMCNMIPGEFVHTFGDVHIYEDHKEAVEIQLERELRELPTLNILTPLKDLDLDTVKNINPEFFVLEDYNPHPVIKAKLSTGLNK